MMFIRLCASSPLQTQVFERGPGKCKQKRDFGFVPDAMDMDSQMLETLVLFRKKAERAATTKRWGVTV